MFGKVKKIKLTEEELDRMLEKERNKAFERGYAAGRIDGITGKANKKAETNIKGLKFT